MKDFWIGCIEDRKDPAQVGRFRVRVLGLHTEDKEKLPTKDLPWCPVVSGDGGNSGMGTTPPFFVEGTWVLISFRDKDRQEPLIHGAISGKPSVAGTAEETGGFFDPEGKYPLKANEPDIHEVARGNLDAANPAGRDALRETDVATADFDGYTIPNTTATATSVTGSDGGTFDMPLVVSGTYAPSYPFNHVFATESGHMLEFDDTASHERVHLSHMSGSYMEWQASGTLTAVTVMDAYDIVKGNEFIHIGGAKVETLDGSFKLKVNKGNTAGAHYDIEVGAGASLNIMVRDGSLNMNVKGDVNQNIDGDVNMSMDNFRVDASNKVSITAGSTILIDGGDVDINGDPINLN